MVARLPYSDRIAFCQNPTAKQLLGWMTEKQSNLSVSADLIKAEQVLKLAEQVGPEICVFKTHIDIIEDFSHDFIDALQALAREYQFLIFEDRKFADIGHTVQLQYTQGIYRIAQWAAITNAHPLPGPGVVEGLKAGAQNTANALLLLAEMSAKDNLIDASYTQKTLAMAENYPDFVMGFVSQHRLNDNPAWIYFTPGIHLSQQGDALGQQYTSPESAFQRGTDVMIVGRGIYAAPDPAATASHYRKTGWQAYLGCLKE
ncbi:MAG: orotidine-5'-phosphate decarboxylase [Gammaproteobacteria bacterium]